ncbi:MAG: extracellular solute-binding protein [Planctomycetes bacterium]|nr:extracellular solute-binding protein [Planctomycetota bacterium]
MTDDSPDSGPQNTLPLTSETQRRGQAAAKTIQLSPEEASGRKQRPDTVSTPPPDELARAETQSLPPKGSGEPTTTPTPTALAVGNRFGTYEITGELGRGGMGVVYRARDTELGREVALKVLGFELGQSERELARFRREASLASQLRHPRIVGVFNFGEIEGRAYYTMPIVEGETLKELLIREGPLKAEHAAHLLEDLARAIDSAHQQRVVHRDLKPANVAIDSAGGPLVLDFGLAKDLAGPDLTRTGEILGTPCYMAPEQATGENDVDHRVDVYALGTILYEILTGQVPYGGQTASEVIRKILYDDPPPPRSIRPDIPFELETIVLAAMRRERYLRYQTAGALADDLARFRREEPVVARRPGLATRALRWMLGHKSTTVLAIVLFLTVMTGGLRLNRWSEQLRVSAQIDEAQQALETARNAGDAKSASESYHEATLLAEAVFREVPDDDGARATLLEALGARAAFAAGRDEWELAELLYGRRARLSGSPEDEAAFRHARGLGKVTVSGLRPTETLTFYRWDSTVGAIDSSRTFQASAQSPVVDLRAGNYLALYKRTNPALIPLPFLIALGRSQVQTVQVTDPGPAPPGMVFIPASALVLTAPRRNVPMATASQSCWIDTTAVTRGAFRAFLEGLSPEERARSAPRNFPPAGPEDALPITGVSWHAAEAFAASLNKRLPTRSEWVAAAGGADGRRYPWGDEPEVGRANLRRDELAPDTDFARDCSPYGVLGLAGNGDEWVRDQGPGESRLLCGIAGAYRADTGGQVRPYSFAAPEQSFPDTTFRCARAVATTAPPIPLGVDAPKARSVVPAERGAPIVLRVAAWPRYADPLFTKRFADRYRAETGVAVVVTQVVTISSNDEYLPLLQASPPVIDLVVPSCDMAPEFIQRGLVQPFRASNEAELLPAFRRPPFLQARGQGYGVAYASGPMWLLTVGQTQPLRRWADLWRPELAGKVAIWDDGVWAVTLAALKLGKRRLFNLSDEDLRDVERELTALLRSGCRLWSRPKQVQDWLTSGSIVACDDWGILAWELSRRRIPVHRVVAIEGTTQWIDSWMLAAHVKGARRRAALAWIEYAISPENQRDLLREAGYDPTNERTVELLDKASALARVRTIRQRRLASIQRWRPVPRRAQYLETWRRSKEAAKR